jgi:hypothetical protein
MAVGLTVVIIFGGALAAVILSHRRWNWAVSILSGLAVGAALWAAAALGWLYWFANSN